MKKCWLFLVLILVFSNLQSQNSYQNIGPENGTLVIVGGAMKSDSIINRFIKLAGGLDAHFVVIPTASSMKNYDENSGFAGTLRNRGATNITVLHTNDKVIANSDSFAKPLRNANAVWFGGGR